MLAFDVKIKSSRPTVTQEDRDQGIMYRYFASRGNQVKDTVTEISYREYDRLRDYPFIVLAHIKWVITGELEDRPLEIYTGFPSNNGYETVTIPGVLTQNLASVRFISNTIPAIESYLTDPQQFYVTTPPNRSVGTS
jgi:hypothetical protein